MPMPRQLAVLAVILLVVAPISAGRLSAGEEPWHQPVPGWTPPAPGEHPRLLFRKSDLPALRQRAQTGEGKAILARLREVLGGGEAMPTKRNPNKTTNTIATEPGFDPQVWTVTHGAGFGLLYQLSGERRYAELARECIEVTFSGQPDRDQRYNFRNPGTGFRLGVVWTGVALAYDLCYDGWDEAFRRRVVDELQNAKEKSQAGNGGAEHTLEFVAGGVKYPPGSNHFGAALPGAGLAALAIAGDPGVDQPRIERVLATLDQSMQRLLTQGFGDGGWFAEGLHTGRIAAQSGAVMLLPAYRNAAGKDWARGRANTRYLSLRLMHEIVDLRGSVSVPSRGPYGSHELWARSGIISHSGEFCLGFGALATLPDERAAMHWIWRAYVEPKVGKTLANPWDTWIYPHHAVWSFVFWPIGEQPKDPDEVLPRALVDGIHQYYVFRDRWQDGDDVVVTCLLGGGPRGYHKCPGGPILVAGEGAVRTFDSIAGVRERYEQAADGSAILAAGGRQLAVDFSGASGARALLVLHGGAGKGSGRAVGPFSVMTVPSALAAQATVAGDTLTLGGQTLKLVDGKLTPGVFKR